MTFLLTQCEVECEVQNNLERKFLALAQNSHSKLFCDPGGTRTHNLQNRNLTFYPLNYGAVKRRKINKICYVTSNNFNFLLLQIELYY